MPNAAAVALPGGIWLDGACCREVLLRPLDGEDEASLLETGEGLLPAQRTTALLARCITRLGVADAVTTADVQALTVGDRDALVLQLRRLTIGNELSCMLTCPNDECGELMELELAVSDLLLPMYPEPKETYEALFNEEDGALRVRFRLPTGGDVEVAAQVAQQDPDSAADLLLRRCVVGASNPDDGTSIAEWPASIAHKLSDAMAELDPQAELTLNLTCSLCGHEFSTLLDPSAFFFQELASRARDLYREVHLLGFYYHWGEAELMSMTSAKRKRYLQLLQEQLTQINHGSG